MQKIGTLSKTRSLIVVPGGGDFADTVRKLDKLFCLSRYVSHRMAVLAMDQYGLLLSDLSDNSVVVRSLNAAKAAVNSAKLPIFLPSQIMFEEDPLENSWAVTSDSIALYIAQHLQARQVLFVTDVDGIYTVDPKKGKNATIISVISPQELCLKRNRTSVDSALPGLLKKWPITCMVVNGFYPERVELLMDGKSTVATLISDTKL
jgi:aspartokinase-like uncharacterized kinase